MAGFYISPYPDPISTLAAGKEVVRLLTTGEAGTDMRHTVGCIMTTAVGLSGIYPGVPGMSAGTLTVQQDSELNVLQSQLEHAIRFPNSQIGARIQTGQTSQPQPYSPNAANPINPLTGQQEQSQQAQAQSQSQPAVQPAQAQPKAERRPLPEGFPKAAPYTEDQIKTLQEYGWIQKPAPEALVAQQQQVSNPQVDAPNAAAFNPGDLLPYLQLLGQILDMIRKRRGRGTT